MCIYYRLQICWESQNPIFKFLHSLSPSPTACMQAPWTFLARRRTIVIIMVDTITLPSSRRVIVKLLWGSSVSPHPLWTQLAPKYLEFCLLDHWSESLEKSLKFSWKQHSSIQRMPKKDGWNWADGRGCENQCWRAETWKYAWNNPHNSLKRQNHPSGSTKSKQLDQMGVAGKAQAAATGIRVEIPEKKGRHSSPSPHDPINTLCTHSLAVCLPNFPNPLPLLQFFFFSHL